MSTEAFLVSPQQAHLLAVQAAAGGRAPVAACRATITGALDAEALARAASALVAEHEILRTTFRATDGGGEQVVHASLEPAVEHTDLSDLDAAHQSASLDALFDEALAKRFDTAAGPMLVLRCAKLGDVSHELIVAVPSLCADAASLSGIVAGLARTLGGGDAGEEPMQYVDVGEWQREILESDDSRPGREYWAARNAATGATPEIPFESSDGAGAAIASVRTELSAETVAKVRQVADAHDASPRDVLLAAWASLLARLSGQSDLRLALETNGRRYEELHDALGPLARALPLSLAVGNATPFGELVRTVAADAASMERWQECFSAAPLVADALAPYAFEHRAAAEPVAGGDRTIAIGRRHAQPDGFRCRLSCEQGADGIALSFDHDAGVLSTTTVERLAGQFEALLADALARPEAEVGDLDALSAAERRDRIHEFNDTDADYPTDLLPHHWIEEQSRNTPDAIAVRQGEVRLSYAELDTRANQLAHHLQARGVGPGTLVALCLERSPEMVIGIVAILKAGAAYVPVDPSYPTDRILFILEDTDAPVLLTQTSLVDQLPQTNATLVHMDTEADAIAAHPTSAPECGAGVHDLVYVIYTSGSTGKPKGVVITHRKLVISNAARVAAFGHTPDAFLLLSSVAFDSSVVGIFWTLCGGGTLVLLPPGAEKDLPTIPATVASANVSHLLTLPSFYRLILENSRPEQLNSLQTVIVAGEACPLKMVEHHKNLMPGVGLFSEYGATETTVFSSVYDCLTQTLPIAPVGAPIENAQMYVLDPRCNPCPIGTPGEVHFGGVALANGYLRRPELTADRFIPDHLGAIPGGRLYKSGDLARHLENGDVEFLGRLDNQVKIRGFRIELEEIEIELLRHPAVKESAVLALTDLSDEKRLVGYVLVEEGMTAPSVTELRDFLMETLPDFMAPGVFVFMDDFPRTPNGKVDRKALPEPGSERPELESDFEAPTSPAETALAEIWADVLGLDNVGVNDNFFELGGDSILSIQIVSRAKQAGLKLTPRMLFENQTIAELAAEAGVAGAPVAEAEQGEVVGAVPLTPVQHWFFELDLPNPGHWNMPMLMEARRRLEPDALRTALGALLLHHDALRARFRRDGEAWVGEIAGADEDVPLEIEDLSGTPAADQPAELAARAARHQASLDIERGPLMRVVLFECGEGRSQQLLWIIHHLAIDGVSWRILLEDLETALDRIEAGAAVELPAKTTSFRHWAQQLTGHATSDTQREESAHWLALADAPADALTGVPPLDHADGENIESSARKVTVSLDAERTRALLSEVPKTYNTQINDVLLTALVHALAGWTGERTVLVNLEGHGREEIGGGLDLSRTVGWFTTDYPVQLTDESPYEPGAALRSIKEQLRRVPRQGFGFGVSQYLDPDAAVRERFDALPQPVVGFNYLGQFDQVFREEARFSYSTAPTGPSQAPDGRRVFVMEAYGLVSQGRLEMDFEYSENLHERATIQALAETFIDSLTTIIEHCLSPEAGGFTASDFKDFGWDETDLASIASAIKKTQQGSGPGSTEGR
jgi:amino acid adenylation domain-containing protein/non-ribosomal peptide synthase protein (TIGR01720 family)